MARDSQQMARYKSRIPFVTKFPRTSEDESRSRWLDFNAPETQSTLQHKPTVRLDEFIPDLKNTGRYNTLKSRQQISERYYESSISPSHDFAASPGAFKNKVETSPYSIAAAVAILARFACKNESEFFTLLADENCQSLIASLDMLIDVVGENEDHLFASFMHFIGKLIEQYEERSDTIDSYHSLEDEDLKNEWISRLRLSGQGLEAAYSANEPEYTEDMLIEVNPDYQGNDINSNPELRSCARGLEAAYSANEPEYTEDMLIEVNPDYEKK